LATRIAPLIGSVTPRWGIHDHPWRWDTPLEPTCSFGGGGLAFRSGPGSMSHMNRGYMPHGNYASRDRGYMPHGNYASRDRGRVYGNRRYAFNDHDHHGHDNFHHGRHGHFVNGVWVWDWWPGYYGGDYYAYNDCWWLRRQALITGSPYWWSRYNACVGYY
jgi:hypothetical protein